MGFNCVTRHPSGEWRPSCEMTDKSCQWQWCLGNGLCARPTSNGSLIMCPDGHQHVFVLRSNSRYKVQLSWWRYRKFLERVCLEIGCPKTIRVDNGPEFISRDLDLWAYHKGVVLDFSRPGKPTGNTFIEAFNGKFQQECLNAHWFLSLVDAA